MKPSPEQVREWAEKAGAKFDPHWGISYNVGTATFERFAELVAQWGAEQARDEANNTPSTEHCLWARNGHTPCQHTQQVQALQTTEEPELPEAVAWQGRWLDQSDDAEGWSEWRAIDTIDLPRWQKRVTNKPGCYEIRALYTAAQMHDHYQAGVLAGMAQHQLTVIDPDAWKPCTPSYLKRGGLCTAPRVWHAATCNHWHPKLDAQAQQKSVYENALRTVLDAVNAYLPPGGISAQECLNRVIAAVDPWPAKGD